MSVIESEQVIDVAKQAGAATGVNEQYIFILLELTLPDEVNHSG